MEKEAWSVYEGQGDGFILEGPSIGAHDVWDHREEVYAASAALEMLEALKALTAHIESGTLVRSIDKDDQPGWALKVIPLANDIGMAKAAIDKAEGK